jgi:hypothetical protein
MKEYEKQIWEITKVKRWNFLWSKVIIVLLKRWLRKQKADYSWPTIKN